MRLFRGCSCVLQPATPPSPQGAGRSNPPIHPSTHHRHHPSPSHFTFTALCYDLDDHPPSTGCPPFKLHHPRFFLTLVVFRTLPLPRPFILGTWSFPLVCWTLVVWTRPFTHLACWLGLAWLFLGPVQMLMGSSSPKGLGLSLVNTPLPSLDSDPCNAPPQQPHKQPNGSRQSALQLNQLYANARTRPMHPRVPSDSLRPHPTRAVPALVPDSLSSSGTSSSDDSGSESDLMVPVMVHNQQLSTVPHPPLLTSLITHKELAVPPDSSASSSEEEEEEDADAAAVPTTWRRGRSLLTRCSTSPRVVVSHGRTVGLRGMSLNCQEADRYTTPTSCFAQS